MSRTNTERRGQRAEVIARFANSIGVFQGGGTKAIAYVGAYKVARENGIIFSETAGTSAGSIVAALIAAGGTPEQIMGILTEQNLRKINRCVKDCRQDRRKIGWWKRQVINCGLHALKKNDTYAKIANDVSVEHFVKHFGVYDSHQLEDCIDGWLTSVCKKEKLLFKDLDRNLFIVSTDLGTNSYKIWSQEKTPEEMVAKAVAASCSIPFYFTPLDGHVDGGLVSNRPDFIFNKLPEHFSIFSFRTKSTPNGGEELHDYVSNLLDAMLSGVDSLQHLQMRAVNTISIECNGINVLDFQSITQPEINSLLRKGERAMQDFIDCMLSGGECTAPDWKNQIFVDKLECMEQLYSVVALWSFNEFSEAIVSTPDLGWVWPLFPTVLSWVKGNRIIRIFAPLDKLVDEKSRAIIRQLSAVGIEVEDVNPDVQLNGFFFKSGDGIWRGVSYLGYGEKFFGKVYASEVDSQIILSQVNRISPGRPTPAPLVPLTLESIDVEKIKELLRANIEGYADVSVSIEEVSPGELTYMNFFVRGDKYIQISHIFSLYGQAHIDSMTPCQINLRGNKKSIITPIIIEEHDGEKIVIKGNIRLLYAYNFGPQRLKAVVIRNVKRPLPSSQRVSVERLFLSDSKRTPKERYGEDFKKEHVRTFDQAFRPNDSYLL